MNDPETHSETQLDIRVDDAALARLHQTLTRRAEDQHLLDIGYRTIDSPLGTLLLAATVKGVVRVGFAIQGQDAVLAELAERVSPRILLAPKRLDVMAHELDEYFAGSRRGFDVPLDLQLAHGFRRQVIEHLRDIGYGRTASYAVVAAAAGSPRAVRAVGTACARNPLPLVLPCHRVVRSDGSMGQYAGGTDAKRTLLDLERGAA